MNPQTSTPRETMRHYLGALAEKLTRNGLLAELVGDIAKSYLTVALSGTPNQTERVLCQPTEAEPVVVLVAVESADWLRG
jgi:hypothetical protein